LASAPAGMTSSDAAMAAAMNPLISRIRSSRS
jgi:hypothetical protein